MKSCPLASHFCICEVTRSRHIWHKIIRIIFFSYLIKIGVVWGVLSGVGGPAGLSPGVTRRLALGENRHGEVKSFLGHHTRHHELAAFHLFFLLLLIDWGTGQNARAFFKVSTQPKSSHKIERWSSCVPKWLHEETSVERKIRTHLHVLCLSWVRHSHPLLPF